MSNIKMILNTLLRKKLLPLVLLASFLAIGGCGNGNEKGEATEETGEAHEGAEAEADVKFVELNEEQFKAADIKFQPLEEKNLSDLLTVTGILDVPPQSLISINAPYGGFLKNTELLEGTRVKKGQVIAVLQHPDYIQLQQDYLQNSGQLQFLEKDYERQKELQKQNVTAAKALQRAEAEYKSMYGIVKGLEAKLKMIGINPNNVLAGNITPNITITSPIAGYVSKVNANIGKYVGAEDVIFEIVDTENLQVELTVFEKDISKIRIGQRIRFTLANEPDIEQTAKVYLIGRSFDESRSVRIHGRLDHEDPRLLPGMYINAVIEMESDKVTAVPKEAIVLSEGKEFIFVRNKDCAEHPECSAHEACEKSEDCKEHPDCEAHEKCPLEKDCKEHAQCEAHEKETGKEGQATDYYTFSKIQVKSGVSDGSFVAINFIDPFPAGKLVVTKGAFSLLSQTKMGGAMDACGQ